MINFLLVFARLSNADEALENLHFFENSYSTEEPCISRLEKNVSRLAPMSGRVEDAQRDLETVMVCGLLLCSQLNFKELMVVVVVVVVTTVTVI